MPTTSPRPHLHFQLLRQLPCQPVIFLPLHPPASPAAFARPTIAPPRRPAHRNIPGCFPHLANGNNLPNRPALFPSTRKRCDVLSPIWLHSFWQATQFEIDTVRLCDNQPARAPLVTFRNWLLRIVCVVTRFPLIPGLSYFDRSVAAHQLQR